jgi:probable phosphoglycerate mutase
MALAALLLDLPQQRHVLGPLANCHWSELTVIAAGVAESDGGRVWRLRAHNAGVAGVIVPLPVHPSGQDEITDADA